jgi:hypothetical protein
LSNAGTSSAIAAAAAAAAVAATGIESREGLRIPAKVNRKQSMSSRVLSTSATNKMSTSYKSTRSDRNRNNSGQKDGSTASSHKRQDSNGSMSYGKMHLEIGMTHKFYIIYARLSFSK